MSQLEVYSMLEPYARVAVASEGVEPGLGWAYSAFLSLLVYGPVFKQHSGDERVRDLY